MPGVALHFLLADRVLNRWQTDHGTEPPLFDVADPRALNAFYHGAVGPDLGYFPGGCRVLSDLAHCVRPAELVRQLLCFASTDRQRAFALGWMTHVLADQTIHPVIGRGVGELLHGRRDRFLDGSAHPGAHLRVENGLDAWFAERHPEVRARRLLPALDDADILWVVQAYAETYGVALPTELFVRSHLKTTTRVGQALASLGVVAALMKNGGPSALSLVRRVFRAAYGAGPMRSLALAYLNPVAPAEWLLDDTAAVMDTLTDTFLEHASAGAVDLEDLNLDTGMPAASEGDHVGTRRAMQGLWALAHRPEANPLAVAAHGAPLPVLAVPRVTAPEHGVVSGGLPGVILPHLSPVSEG